MHIVIFSSSTIISSLFFFFFVLFFSCSFFSISYSTHNISPADIRRYSWTCVSEWRFSTSIYGRWRSKGNGIEGTGSETQRRAIKCRNTYLQTTTQLQQLKDVDSRTRKLLYEQSSWQLNLVVHTRVTGLCAPCGKERRTIRTKQMV